MEVLRVVAVVRARGEDRVEVEGRYAEVVQVVELLDHAEEVAALVTVQCGRGIPLLEVARLVNSWATCEAVGEDLVEDGVLHPRRPGVACRHGGNANPLAFRGYAPLVILPRRPLSWRVFLLRLLQLNVGLVIYGLSVALMVSAGIGLGPWDVFHQGISRLTPLSMGQAMILAGLAVLVYSVIGPKVRIGIATVLNMVLIGVWCDVFLAVPGFPHGTSYLLGVLLFCVGMVLCGVATGLYITAGLGAGPRDGFVLGVAKVTGAKVRTVRTVTEIAVFALGWLMGAPSGWARRSSR